jgi:hypothetical protein
MGSGSSLSLCPEGAQTRLYNRIAQNGPSGSYSPKRSIDKDGDCVLESLGSTETEHKCI